MRQRDYSRIKFGYMFGIVCAWFALQSAQGLEDNRLLLREGPLEAIDSSEEDWLDSDEPISERHLDPGSDSNDGKIRTRGSPDACTGLSSSADREGLPVPCRHPGSKSPDPLAPPNQLTVGFFVGLPPRRKTVGPLATDVMSNLWDRNISNMNFFLTPGYEKQHDSSEEEERRGRDRGGIRGSGGVRNPQNNVRDRNNQNNNLRTLEQRYQVRSRHRETTRAMVFDMFHTETESDLTTKHEIRWWWSVDMTFECYWEEDDAPVGQAVMDVIQHNMTRALERLRGNLQNTLQRDTATRILRVRTLAAGIPTPAEDNNDIAGLPTPPPTEAPTVSPTPAPQQAESLDAQEWDWRKYLGLSLLVATVVIAILLRIFGARRQRKREQHQNWGNLGSKDGVDQLLNTGWVLKGSQMQIYDKTGVGYSDDDSMFLGGFEQKEAVVGTEVTVTHPETSETPEGARSHLSSKVPSRSRLSGSGVGRQ